VSSAGRGNARAPPGAFVFPLPAPTRNLEEQVAMKLPQPMTIVVSVVIALGAIWLANNVNAIAKLVGPRAAK
jgi:hypothetical protein